MNDIPGENKVSLAIVKMKKQIADRIKAGLVTKEKVADLHKKLDMELGEYVRFQEAKSLAFASGLLTGNEAQTIYRFLGNAPDHFNKQPIEVKVVLTKVFEELLLLRR